MEGKSAEGLQDKPSPHFWLLIRKNKPRKPEKQAFGVFVSVSVKFSVNKFVCFVFLCYALGLQFSVFGYFPEELTMASGIIYAAAEVLHPVAYYYIRYA